MIYNRFIKRNTITCPVGGFGICRPLPICDSHVLQVVEGFKCVNDGGHLGSVSRVLTYALEGKKGHFSGTLDGVLPRQPRVHYAPQPSAA